MGDASAVGEGVMELRIHVGAGYRVYFGRHGQAIVILLMGGSKKRQAADIRLAKQYWLEWKSTQS
ncbi:type II toxin-antitoxin system RelE/ParE family toxin [Rugamonas sp. DEMB1]|uniref:type II toxin-antitoxin system RelE/ParE family toxin n=1 Tax=Rugamonas sp. DEMB1 TaxID=3039386 RepID=UPI00391B8D9A